MKPWPKCKCALLGGSRALCSGYACGVQGHGSKPSCATLFRRHCGVPSPEGPGSHPHPTPMLTSTLECWREGPSIDMLRLGIASCLVSKCWGAASHTWASLGIDSAGLQVGQQLKQHCK